MSSGGRDYRGRHEAGSSSRNSSRSSSHNQRHRSGPYDSTMTPTAPQEDEVNYRQEFVERRAAPIQRPTMVVDMYHKSMSSHPGASGSLDEDEVLARKLQADINAEFGVLSGDDDLPPPPPPSPPPPRPSSRYDVAPVQNSQLPFAKRPDSYDYNYRNDYNDYNYTPGTSTPNYTHNKFREQDEYSEFHKKASRVGARGQSARVHRSTYPNPHQAQRVDAYHDELLAAAAAEEESRRLARQLQDEEMARQLQAQQQQELLEEKEREERRRRRQRAAREEARRSAAAAAAAAAASPHATAASSSSRQVNSTSNRENRKESRVLTPTSTASFSDSSADMIAARRIAQELEDAEMAHRLAQYEQEVARRNDQAANGPATRKQQLVFYRLLPLFCIAVALVVGLLFVFGVFSPDSVKNGWSGIFDGKENWVDPFAGDVNLDGDGSSPSLGKMAWATDGQGGLQLSILFAMEDSWSSLFQTAVDNWDEGFPIDPLTLTVSRVTYDPECVAQVGYIKVCNGDYGATRWKGLNDIAFNSQTNEIVKSSAKINEYYLNQDSDEQKLYTLCHEIGHGFGLPHWDEDFFNKDMGNCMDYTYVLPPETVSI